MPPLPTVIPASVQWTVVAVLAGCALLFVVLLYISHLHRNRQRRRAGVATHTLGQHVRTHAVHHLSAGLVLVLAALIAAGAGVALIVHHGGFRLKHPFHLLPPHRPPVIAPGGAGVYTTPDLSALVKAATTDQKDTLACCGIAVVRLDEMNRSLRGERVPVPLSGYKAWWWAVGGRNVGSVPDDDAAAYNAHGAEPEADWGPHGYSIPSQDDPVTTAIKGTKITWDFYVDSGGGLAGYDDLVWRLEHRTPMGIVWAVHTDGDAARGVAYTWDGGNFYYWHCAEAVQYTSNYPGIGPAILVWNHYGLGYGAGGYIWLPAAVVRSHVAGGFTETPGPPIWLPPPAPTALATRRPTAAPTRTATPRPAPVYHGVYTVRSGSNLRASPAGRVTLGLPAGTRLRSLGQTAPGWARVQLLVRGVWHVGWVPSSAVTRSTALLSATVRVLALHQAATMPAYWGRYWAASSNLRTQPSPTAAIIRGIGVGELERSMGQTSPDGQWALVTVRGVPGWVPRQAAVPIPG